MKTFLIIIVLFMSFNINNAQETTKKESQTFEELIKPYVLKTLDAIDKGTDLVIQETPVIIQQYLVFKTISYWLSIFFGIILIFLSIYLGRIWERYLDWDEAGPEWIIYILGPFTGILFIFTNIMPAIKVTWFPKLYLVEHFIKLLN